MSNHTPGEWKRKGLVVFAGGLAITQNLGYASNQPNSLVAIDLDEKEANARLIAAAPEMLDFIKSLENDSGVIPAGLWEMRNKLIAKAEGRTDA